jgi:DNA-binding phage protein
MSTLPELLHAEIQRCRQVANDCAALGSSGAFAAALLGQALREADAALRSRDVTAIQDAVARLRSFREVAPDTPVRSTHLATPTRRPAAGRPLWAPARPAPREQFFTWKRAA